MQLLIGLESFLSLYYMYFWTTKSNLFAPSLFGFGLNLIILLILAETVSESNNNSVLTTTS